MLTTLFRNLLENHLDVLRNDNSTSYVAITGQQNYKYVGDFYQLIYSQFNVPQDLWWLTMRMNYLHSPMDYNGDLVSILVPNMSRVKALLTKFTNTVSLL
jgi:hypothetical protein